MEHVRTGIALKDYEFKRLKQYAAQHHTSASQILAALLHVATDQSVVVAVAAYAEEKARRKPLLKKRGRKSNLEMVEFITSMSADELAAYWAKLKGDAPGTAQADAWLSLPAPPSPASRSP